MPANHTLDLQGYSYDERQGLLPALTSAFTQMGCWVLERKSTSSSTVEFRIEVQLWAIPELYASLVGAGIELTRGTHAMLTDLCTCRHFARTNPVPSAILTSDVITLRLALSFLEDVTLHSLLMTGSGLA
jgi:hypothetical protein